MNRFEKTIMIGSLVYMAVYFPYFFVQMYRGMNGVDVPFSAIFPYHILGTVLNFAAFIVTIRDLYLRPFPNPNTKLTWMLLFFFTGGLGWLAYVFRHALKPRTEFD